MRNIPNTYIFCLALADLLVVTTCVPFTSTLYTVESWPYGVYVCKISETAKNIGIGVSVFTLTALAADRYFAVASPLHIKQGKIVPIINCILIWVLAAILSITDAIFARVITVKITCEQEIKFCSPFPAVETDHQETTYKKINVTIKALIYFIIPLTIVAIFYILTAVKLYQSSRALPGNSTNQITSQVASRKHVAKMVLIFVMLFALCFLPHHVFMLWFHLAENAEDEYNDWWHALKITGFYLSYINSCVNPVALHLASAVFRPYFNKYLCCKKNTL